MRWLFILCLLVVTSEGITQEYPTRNYNMQSGITHASVYRTFQDRRGFIWFCTDYGICSFDGKTFKNLENDSLLNGPILSMNEDGKGNKLVCSIKEGLLYLSDEGIRRYPMKGRLPKYIIYAAEHKGRLWMSGRDNGVYLYVLRNNVVCPANLSDRKKEIIMANKIVQYDDELLIPSAAGLYRIRDTVAEPFLQELVHENIEDVRKTGDGTYWIACTEKLVGIKNNRIIYSHSVEKGKKIKNILCDRNGNVWLALYKDGVLLLKNGGLLNVTSRLSMNTTLINDLFEDGEGNIWFATYNCGVTKLGTTDLQKYSPGERQLNFYCKSISALDPQRLVIGTIGKVHIWEKGKISPLNIHSLAADEFIYNVSVHGQKIFVCTPNGIIIKDLSGRDSMELRPSPPQLGAIASLVDHGGVTWGGGYSRLYHIYPDGRAVIDTNAVLAKAERFNALLEDDLHNLWIGAKTGLLKFDRKNFTGVPLPGGANQKVIYHMIQDSHGRIWLATLGGLICIDRGKARLFTTADGLTHNKCNRMVEDRNNTLWVGTLHGISYMDLGTFEIRPYSSAIYPDEVLSLHCTPENSLFVGTANGLFSFPVNKKLPGRTAPPLYITAIRTNGLEIKMPLKANVSYADNKLQIDFIALSFQDANTVEYRYKIMGLANDYIYTTNHSIELPSLPSGDYTFILSARTNKGPWSATCSLPISVSTPYWKTKAFILFVSLVLFIFIFMISRWQTRRQESRKREKLSLHNNELIMHNKIAHLKQQALSALINPHFIFNCMNSIQHYLNRHDNEKANAYLADFAQLIRMTMENAEEAFIGLEEELKRMHLYLNLEQLRFGEKLSYEINVREDVHPSLIRIPNMILQPYIENAIWHGIMPKQASGKIIITFSLPDPDTLLIGIVDNGVGLHFSKRPEKASKKQFGMSLTEQRLQLLTEITHRRFSVSVSSNAAAGQTGTSVQIILPILQDDPEVSESAFVAPFKSKNSYK